MATQPMSLGRWSGTGPLRHVRFFWFKSGCRGTAWGALASNPRGASAGVSRQGTGVRGGFEGGGQRERKSFRRELFVLIFTDFYRDFKSRDHARPLEPK